MPFDLKAVQKPLAGKPVWVWGVVGGVAVLGFYYWNASHKAAQAAASTTTTTGGAPANAAVDTFPVTSNGGYTNVDYSGSGVVANAGNTLGNTTLETNKTWIAKGELITGGGRAAHIALSHFIEGKPLTPAQAAYVVTTRSVLGNPPESPNLAISVISNAVPVAKTTNSVAKVNPAKKAPIVAAAPAAQVNNGPGSPARVKAQLARRARKAAAAANAPAPRWYYSPVQQVPVTHTGIAHTPGISYDPNNLKLG
jgi:hypothetical protein